MLSRESDILHKLRLIEQLKADLLASVAELFQAMAQSGGKTLAGALAAVVVSCYVLGRRMGIAFGDLDDAIVDKLAQTIKKEHEVEKWFGDHSELSRHLRQKKQQ